MITKNDLEEAIKECEGQRSPSANTAIKLAAYYTIRHELFPETESIGYSYDAPPVYEKDKMQEVFDELLETLKTLHPRLYDSVMRKLSSLD